MKNKICIVDYNAGNLRSVKNALDRLGYDNIITSEPDKIIQAGRIIFPGVGAAGSSMATLQEFGIADAMKEVYKKGNPILGICLGSQIILEHSEEDDTVCLGLVSGHTQKIPAKEGYKIPHMGWNTISISSDHFVIKDVPNNSAMYFVHSYYPVLDDRNNELCNTDYVVNFSSGYAVNNLVSFQFHPEKSGEIGLTIIDNFCKWEM